MLFGKQQIGMRRSQTIYLMLFLPLLLVILIVLSTHGTTQGSIVILEKPDGTEFAMDFKDWSETDKYELSLARGDTLQIEVTRESGKVSLTVRGKNGNEPYTGNNLAPGLFTLTVSQTDQYVIWLTGNDATGKVIVKKLSASQI